MKKVLLIISLVLLIILLSISLYKRNESKDEDTSQLSYKKAEDLSPISKDNAIKILKSEFGEGVINSIQDIKEEDEYYIIDVNVNLGNSDEHTHTHEELSTEEVSIADNGDHIINLGIHKINKYTGELVDNN